MYIVQGIDVAIKRANIAVIVVVPCDIQMQQMLRSPFGDTRNLIIPRCLVRKHLCAQMAIANAQAHLVIYR